MNDNPPAKPQPTHQDLFLLGLIAVAIGAVIWNAKKNRA